MSVLGNDIAQAGGVTRELVASLVRSNVPAIGFVNEHKLQSGDATDPRRVAPSLAAFQQNVLDGERITRALLRAAGKTPVYFRHPFLHTGRTEEGRRELERFLSGHGYRVAPVTIDNSDYVFAAAFDRANHQKVRLPGT